MFPVCSQSVPSLFPVIAIEFHRVPSIPCVSSSLYNLTAVQDSSDNRNTGNNRNKVVGTMACRRSSPGTDWEQAWEHYWTATVN